MLVANPLGYLFTPLKQWDELAKKPLSSFPAYLIYPAIMAVIPAVAWYHGVTEVGWRVGDGEVVRLTRDSAMPIIALFYLTMLAAVFVIGYMTHWMSQTYGAETSVAKGVAVIGFVSTPLFIAGAVGWHPVLWLDMLVGIAAVSWALYLLYVGIPLVMRQPKEQGFLYASAIVAIALVMLICIMVGSVILWDFGATPVFTD